MISSQDITQSISPVESRIAKLCLMNFLLMNIMIFNLFSQNILEQFDCVIFLVLCCIIIIIILFIYNQIPARVSCVKQDVCDCVVWISVDQSFSTLTFTLWRSSSCKQMCESEAWWVVVVFGLIKPMLLWIWENRLNLMWNLYLVSRKKVEKLWSVMKPMQVSTDHKRWTDLIRDKIITCVIFI